MKRYQKNKVYDTTTARSVGYRGNEFLFRKMTGEFFLVTYLGDMEGRNADGMELQNQETSFKPLSYKEAKAWVEGNLEPEKLKEYFEIDGNDSLRMLTVSLRDSQKEKLRQYAFANGLSISGIIGKWIDELIP